MVDESEPARSVAHDEPRRGPEPVPAGSAAAAPWDVFPPGPNVLAALVGFVGLMCAPWVCLHILSSVWEDAIGEDQIASRFMWADFEETLVIAVVGTLVFLVIVAILQVWQYHRPFPSGWPIVLAFPIAWALLVPESLLRGGSLLSGAVVGSAIALDFGIHWAALVYLREAMD